VGPREFHAEIPSTQDRAIELARGGAPEGTRIVALRQTRGRGRLDHAWASPAGGLYLSIVLRVPPEHVTLLPLALGVRLARELGEQYARPFQVKWPNDVLVALGSERPLKVAGILVDRVESPGIGAVEVAGIGVNVTTERASFPAELRETATSLAEVTSEGPTLDAVEETVVRSAMKAAIGLRGPGGVEATRALCRRWLYGVGRRVTVDGRDAGTIVGLGDEGELLLAQGEERVAIRAGDVRVEGVA
jgi:BirA family transcriptional regulator, biotin operon repressor / biotin---[acetyl-CoA-carboxylase] ligase